MNLNDYQDYKKDNVKASKSKLKEYIQIYSDIVKNNYKDVELETARKNILSTYPNEIYFTLTDESNNLVKFNLVEGSKKYIIPIFTDIREYAVGSAKISKLFLDKLDLKVITPGDIEEIAKSDKFFQGFVINPHSQNFNMNRDGEF